MTRDRFTEMIDRVENGEEFTITRDGKPVAVLLNPERFAGYVDELEALSADAVLPTEEST